MTNNIHVESVLTEHGWLTHQSIEFANGIITKIYDCPLLTDDPLLLKGCLIPGFVDLQVNGGGGALLNTSPSYEGIKIIANAHVKYGTTAFLPTLITDHYEIMCQAADAVAEAIAVGHPMIKGIHFEGPFLSAPKKGVHCEDRIREPTEEELSLICRKDLGKVLVTLAPETVKPEVIQYLVSEGVVVSLGHSNASSKTVKAALEAGASGFTHLFNAMSPMTSREPGMVGYALADSNAYCGLIVDHHHVHPVSALVAIKAKTDKRLMLVTDAMAHVGTSQQTFAFFDTEIVRHDNKLMTPNGTLAGSCLDMFSALMNTYSGLDVPLESASRMASATPAEFIGLGHDIGRIAVGAKADFVLIHGEQIENVWLHGNLVNREKEEMLLV